MSVRIHNFRIGVIKSSFIARFVTHSAVDGCQGTLLQELSPPPRMEYDYLLSGIFLTLYLLTLIMKMHFVDKLIMH